MSDVSKTNELIEQLRAFGNADFMGESGIPGFRLLWDAADALESATRVPEQGEANAAIERVRALHPNVGGECHTCSNESGPTQWPCPTIAAIDGAPEPEWEYSRGILRKDGLLEVGFGLPRDQVGNVRRRKAGPWEQIKGESE